MNEVLTRNVRDVPYYANVLTCENSNLVVKLMEVLSGQF